MRTEDEMVEGPAVNLCRIRGKGQTLGSEVGTRETPLNVQLRFRQKKTLPAPF